MNPERRKRIWGLALPIIGGMISQNVLNLVDTFMVGFLGNAALAAVGLGGFANFMCQAVILGISVGVQATAARRKGEGRTQELAAPLNGALLVVLVTGFFLSAILLFLVPSFYPYLNSDPEVIEQGVPYLQARVAAIIFVGMNFSFRGYWNAVDLSRLYMSTLIVMHISNIILNYALIFGKLGAPELGALGAGIGTSVATVIGTIVYFFLGFRFARKNGFLSSMPSWKGIVDLVRLSIPNSIQQLFFSAGFTATYWIIGKVGTVELAAANVLINLTLIMILPAIALGLSAATLVGQALGRREPDDAYRWGWDVVRASYLLFIGLGLVMAVVPGPILGAFLHDAQALEVAKLPLQIVGLTIVIDAAGLILMNALLGAGATGRVMRVSIGMQWFLFLPLAYLAGPVMGYGLLTIWVLQSGYRGIQAVIFMVLWKSGQWRSIEI